MAIAFKQLELDLWGDLQSALNEPEVADLQLRVTLRPHLAWHGARLSFVAAFLIALVRVKAVNFAELATAFSGQAQAHSHYKRLQRFFRDYEIDYAEIAQAVVTLMAISKP